MVQNVNWPLMDEAVSFSTGPNTTPTQLGLWASLIERTEGTWTSSRGRQYELDQVQAGRVNSTYRNTDAALDPGNTSGPFYPQVTPFRAYRRRAQVPATVNLLTASQATAGAVADTATGTALTVGTLPSFVQPGVFTLTTAVVSSVRNYQAAIPASAATGAVIMSISGWSVLAGQQYSATFTATQTGLSSPTPQVAVQFTWYGPTGSVVSTSTVAGVTISGTTTVTGSATAPAGACGATAQTVLANSPTVSSSGKINIVGWQVQKGTPTTYVQPGSWYSLFTGFVSRWPQTWTDGGTYGTTQIQAVDAFGYLSQRQLLSPAYMEMLALGPTWFYPLDEDTGATLFYDLTAQRIPIDFYTPNASPSQILTAGVELQNTGGWLPGGIGGPVLDIAIPAGGPAVSQLLDLTAGATVKAGPATAAWSRIIAFRAPQFAQLAGDGSWLALTSNVARTNTITVVAGYDASGNYGKGTGNGISVTVAVGGSNVGEAVDSANTNLSDGGWHLFAFGGTATTFAGWLDGNPITAAGNGAYGTYGVGDFDTFAGGIINQGFFFNGPEGQIAYVAELPFQLTNAQMTAIYSTFRYGGSGLGTATSASRYKDILRWATWPGPQSEDNFTTGETVAYGPAVDLLATANSVGTDGVTALQTVVDTDNGTHIVTDTGTVDFKARRHRYNITTAKVTFGENTAGGEIPYTTVGFGLDTSLLANDAAITATGNSNITQRAQNATSIANYGDVQLQRNVNTLNTYELSDAAQFLANHDATPLQRLESISISPSTFTIGGVPSLTAWEALLDLHFGDPVTVSRRPPGAPVISFNGFVEQIAWSINDAGSAVCTLQISPNQGLQFWEVAATTLSLKSSASASATSVTINPLPDSATNAIQSSFPTGDAVEVGTYNAVIDFGTAVAEYITVTPVTNSAGYTSATLTVGQCVAAIGGTAGAGLRFAHAASAIVQYIGDALNIAPFDVGGTIPTTTTALTPYLSPANVLDGFCALGTTTIVGY